MEWTPALKAPKYQIVNGYKFPPKLPRERIEAALNYKPSAKDLFVVTYPKCGTTWTQQICVLIHSNGELSQELKEKGLINKSPFLEWLGAQFVDAMPEPKVIKTHLPFDIQPYNSETKYIYVTRNPKDACVSYFHHVQLFPDYSFDADFHQYLRSWINGNVESGKYSDHVLSWWKHKDDENVLFMLYEELQEDIRKSIVKIASFMGNEYKQKIESTPQVLENIVKHCSFSFMKETTNSDYEKAWKSMDLLDESKEFNFVRKGVVGDWKTHFTDEDNSMFEQWFHESFDGTGIEHLWDKYDIFNN